LTAEFKAQVVLDLLSGAKSRAELCREPQLAASGLAEWKAIVLRHAPAAFESPEHRSRPEAAQGAALERLVGRLTLANDRLNKATSLLHQRSRPSGR
jgi:transposase-like protein